MPAYTAIPADLSRDRATILNIWRRNLSSIIRLEEKYRWHFLDNPQGPARCWLLLADSEPIGTVGLGMRAVQVGGEVAQCGVACDLAVDREHRFLQPALVLQKAAVKAGLRMVYGLPNGNGAATVRRIGYRDAGHVHRYVRLIRPSYYLAREPRIPSWTRFAAPVIDRLYALAALPGAYDKRYAVDLNPDLDGRFDGLWQRRKADLPIATVRDSRYLRWRFLECPLQQYTTVALFSPDRTCLQGYAVVYHEGDQMVLTDLLTSGQPPDASALFAAVLTHARDTGAAAVTTQARLMPVEAAALHAHGFSQRSVASDRKAPAPPGKAASLTELSRTLLVYSELATEPALAGGWFFTAGDEPYN